MQPPIGFTGRPTQAPLNREQQAQAFSALKQTYFQEPLPTPVLGLQPIKEYKLGESEALKSVAAQMQERNMKVEHLQKVEEKVEEIKQTETIKQFYCRHVYSLVKANFMGFPVRYKVCGKCGAVK